MYICVYVCLPMYVCVYTCTYLNLCIRVYIYICLYTHIHTCTCISIHIHVHQCEDKYMHICIYFCTCVCACVHVCVRVCVWACVYRYISIWENTMHTSVWEERSRTLKVNDNVAPNGSCVNMTRSGITHDWLWDCGVHIWDMIRSDVRRDSF